MNEPVPVPDATDASAAAATRPRLVYVCEGGDCSEMGSVELHNELKEMLAERDPDKTMKLTKYPCFGGCEHGINVAVYPDRAFYSKITMDDLPRLCDRVCDGGADLDDKKGIVAKDVESIVWELLDTGF